MKYTFYTDGASSNNQNKDIRQGGFAFLNPDTKEVYFGFENFATNNKMELSAIKEALKTVKDNSEVIFYTDSNYVITVLTGGKIKKNIELILEIKNIIKNKNLKIKFNHVKAHTGDIYNEIVDKYAKTAIEKKFEKLQIKVMEG